MLALLNPAAIIASWPYVAIVAAAMMLWNVVWENPRIRAAARADLVNQAEAAAGKAQVEEMKRQANAAIKVAADFNEMVRKQAADLASQSEAREKELGAWEDELKASKRSCPLSADDIRRLRK